MDSSSQTIQTRATTEAKLERLNKRLGTFSRNLAQCEALYRDLGLAYYDFPISTRAHLFSDHDREQLRKAFHPATAEEGTQLTSFIQSLREHREIAKTALSNRDVATAKKALDDTEDIYESTKDELLELQQSLDRYHTLYAARPLERDRENEGIPKRPSEGRAKYIEVRDWCMCLPEVRYAFRRTETSSWGMMTPTQAYESTISMDEDRPIPELEFEEWDDEDEDEDEDELPGESENGAAEVVSPARLHFGASVWNPREETEGHGEWGVDPARLPGAWAFR